MSQKIKRLLIVGLGSIGSRHYKIIQHIRPDIKLAVLHHENTVNLPNSSDRFTQIKDALNFKPDAAIIANPASFHVDVAIILADAGIHLFIEKPISNHSAGVIELIKKCQSKKIILMIGYNMRFLPSLKVFRKHLNDKKMGDLLYIRSEVGQHLSSWRAAVKYTHSVSAQRKLGGGVLLELSHEIDYLQWLFGEIEWVNAHVSQQSKLDIDVADTANMLIGFKSTHASQALVANLSMDFIRHDTTRQCVAIGEFGTLRWDGIKSRVDFYPENGEQWQDLYSQAVARDYTYIEELTHFFLCIEDSLSPTVSGEDGLKTLRVVEAAEQSSASKQLIYLENVN